MLTSSKTSFWVIVKNGSYVPAFFLTAGISVTAIHMLGILLLIDTFLGVVKSIKIRGGSGFTSRSLGFGILSKILLILIPITLAIASHGISIDLSPLVSSTLTVLILSETYSIIGNIHCIRTGKEVPEFDAVQMILSWIKSLLEKLR